MNNKQITLEFLNLAIAGKFDEAYQKHVNIKGRHHNIFSPAGFEGLKKSMEENDAEFPQKKISIKHVLADGDLVITHSHVVLKEKEVELIAFHLFRFEKGKIVEMWDCGQTIPKDLTNKDGAF